MSGKGPAQSDADLPPNLRTYRLIQIMHAPPSAWEHEPAHLLDELLLIDNAIQKGRNA